MGYLLAELDGYQGAPSYEEQRCDEGNPCTAVLVRSGEHFRLESMPACYRDYPICTCMFPTYRLKASMLK
jgi:hypothetical protein